MKLIGENTSVPRHNDPGGLMQMASPSVIAKPGPLGQDRIEFGARQRNDVGETCHEPFVVRYHRCDLSLLQHNF